MDADVIVVGAGLTGLVAAHELTSQGRRVALVDQENAANLGGQAFWSFGGLFLVDSPEQRRLGIKDSFDLAWNDWQGSAQFDRVDDEDSWAVRWARAYVEFAAGEKRSGWTGTATPCPASMSPGAPAPASWSRSSTMPSRPPAMGCSPSTTATRSTSW
jgi:predicted oxidoreductase